MRKIRHRLREAASGFVRGPRRGEAGSGARYHCGAGSRRDADEPMLWRGIMSPEPLRTLAVRRCAGTRAERVMTIGAAGRCSRARFARLRRRC
jgi:hypothetical protein